MRRPDEPRRWTRRSVLLALAGAGLAVPACEFGQLFSWNGGKPVIFGYGTAPNFDRRIKTVRIKMFKDSTFWAVVPTPGLEEQLTLYLTQQIEQKTPYKVCSGDADTELSGSIRSFVQVATNYTQLNEIREVETTLTCEVIWKDLRTGKLLSSPAGRITEEPVPAGLLPGQLDPLNQATGIPGPQQNTAIATAPISPAGNAATFQQGSPPPTDAGNPVPGASNQLGPQGGPPMPPGAPGSVNGPKPVIGVLIRSVAYYRPEIGQSILTAQQDNCNFMAAQIINMMETPW